MPFAFEKVVKLMQDVLSKARAATGKSVVFVIGNTGVGKSTLVNYLQGYALQKIQLEQNGKLLGPNVLNLAETKLGQKKIAPIGHGTGIGASQTLYPEVFEDKSTNIWYCDCPGFLDNRGIEFRLCASFATELAIKSAHTRKAIIVVIEATEFTVCRGNLLQTLQSILGNFLQDVSSIKEKDAIQFLVTKSDCLPTGIQNKIEQDAAQGINYFQTIIKAYIESAVKDSREWQILQLMNERIYAVNMLRDEDRAKIRTRFQHCIDIEPMAFRFDTFGDERIEFNRIAEFRLKEFEKKNNQLVQIIPQAKDKQSQINKSNSTIKSLEHERNSLENRKCCCDQNIRKIQSDINVKERSLETTNKQLRQNDTDQQSLNRNRREIEDQLNSHRSNIIILDAKSQEVRKAKESLLQQSKNYRLESEHIQEMIMQKKNNINNIENNKTKFECGTKKINHSWNWFSEDFYIDFGRNLEVYVPLHSCSTYVPYDKGKFEYENFLKINGRYSVTYAADALCSPEATVRIYTLFKNTPANKQNLKNLSNEISNLQNKKNKLQREIDSIVSNLALKRRILEDNSKKQEDFKRSATSLSETLKRKQTELQTLKQRQQTLIFNRQDYEATIKRKKEELRIEDNISSAYPRQIGQKERDIAYTKKELKNIENIHKKLVSEQCTLENILKQEQAEITLIREIQHLMNAMPESHYIPQKSVQTKPSFKPT